MYVPRFNVMDADEVRPLVVAAGSAELITVGDVGFPRAPRLPVLWSEDRLNRSAEDRSGVIAGLLAEPGAAGRLVASQMQADLDRPGGVSARGG